PPRCRRAPACTAWAGGTPPGGPCVPASGSARSPASLPDDGGTAGRWRRGARGRVLSAGGGLFVSEWSQDGRPLTVSRATPMVAVQVHSAVVAASQRPVRPAAG